MTDELAVAVNRDRLHAIETATAFETTGSFAVALRNHDAPVHVHLHLDDDLSAVASLTTSNHFVDENGTRRVAVEVDDAPRPVEGKLKVVTGHGAETAYVEVSIVEPEERADAVDVDERLSVPQRPEPDDDPPFDPSGFEENAPVLVLGGLAILLAAGVATLASGPVVLLGAFAVLAGVGTAVYLLR